MDDMWIWPWAIFAQYVDRAFVFHGTPRLTTSHCAPSRGSWLGPLCAPWCTTQVGGAGRGSMVHNVAMHHWSVFDNEKTCDLCEKLLMILYLHSPKLPVKTEFSSFRKWTLYLFREISTDSSWFILWPLSLAYHYISHGLHCFFMQGLNLSWTIQCAGKLVTQVSRQFLY